MNTVFPTLKADAVQIGGGHYREKAIQPWDAMRSWMTPEQFEGYLRGCAIKYLARYPDKNGLQDVEKAGHYIQKLIEEMKSRQVVRKPIMQAEGWAACGNVGMEAAD
jgi:hypothetical protein